MIFTSKDKQFSFLLNDSFLAELIRYIAKSNGNETGGILIGNYNSNQNEATVKRLTGPPKDSQSGFSWFRRGLMGLQGLLDKHWNKKEYYLGEWHYHPFSSPNPSFQDIQQMKEIASTKSYHCPEPILLIIGGEPKDYEIKAFVTTLGKFFELQEMKSFDKIN